MIDKLYELVIVVVLNILESLDLLRISEPDEGNVVLPGLVLAGLELVLLVLQLVLSVDVDDGLHDELVLLQLLVEHLEHFLQVDQHLHPSELGSFQVVVLQFSPDLLLPLVFDRQEVFLLEWIL